jgi:anti-sigma factor RsiW
MTGKDAVTNSDPTELGRWLETRTGYPVEVPAISNAQLIGGRIADLHGVPTASATYMIEGKQLTYFELPNELRGLLPTDERVHTVSAGEFTIATWTAAGSARALVARIGSRELVAVAQECRRMEPIRY